MELNILITLGLVVLYFITRTILYFVVRKLLDAKDAPMQRKAMVKKFLTTVHLGAYLFAGLLVFGIDYANLMVFLSSTFAVLGVALFAQWSILSNITAGVLIFFNFPYRVGDHIKVINKDFDISGVIEEISTFHVLIKKSDGDLITYPNSMILQVPVILLANGESKVKPEQIESD
ncbi:mechanosensitive ion channel family protein [Aliiglaciecola sp. CAU 1673]|uniref:mechanosensitive ion channel domain-containing protein n=1 Tax=Aliiglaciecola sp. CAU 1673 TaxID=3032595 RepID=UPI0023DA0613|nr:mechanosensitive ion channel family protein [Aliiglaciecola sp. CAU 1673]MDF2178179.1 mechanosensitive ion channel family protein [Aliiglaciecola sp. CAU 1673]